MTDFKFSFASGAEAVAHYYNQGFDATGKHGEYRYMRNYQTNETVRIMNEDFLKWKVEKL